MEIGSRKYDTNWKQGARGHQQRKLCKNLWQSQKGHWTSKGTEGWSPQYLIQIFKKRLISANVRVSLNAHTHTHTTHTCFLPQKKRRGKNDQITDTFVFTGSISNLRSGRANYCSLSSCQDSMCSQVAPFFTNSNNPRRESITQQNLNKVCRVGFKPVLRQM